MQNILIQHRQIGAAGRAKKTLRDRYHVSWLKFHQLGKNKIDYFYQMISYHNLSQILMCAVLLCSHSKGDDSQSKSVTGSTHWLHAFSATKHFDINPTQSYNHNLQPVYGLKSKLFISIIYNYSSILLIQQQSQSYSPLCCSDVFLRNIISVMLFLSPTVQIKQE